jgi:hypothetical protein
MLLGDFNDDVDQSVIGNPSSYQKMVEDTARYNTTLEISKAGAFSYLSSGGFLDHIVSNELTDEYVPNSIMVYDQEQTYLVTTTTSDHGPVLARFELKEDVTLSTNDVIGKMS